STALLSRIDYISNSLWRPGPTGYHTSLPTKPRKLRSQDWFAQPTYESLTHRAAIRAEGYTPEVFQNRPVIGICNSFSELNHCNLHLRTVAEAVKRGVWAAGGFPLEFPTISLGEIYMKIGRASCRERV